MEPGESGRDRAARAGQDAEALEVQARELLARAGQARLAAERYTRGHAGEQMIGALLEELGSQGWRVLHDRRRQPRSPANLDHVLVGPAGVFVIDAKNWTGGRLRLDERGMAVGKWRKDDELHSAKVDADIVGEHVDGLGERAGTAAVVAFVHDMGLPAPVQHRGVVLLQREQLLPWLTALPSRLSPDQVSYIAAALHAKFPPRLLPATSGAAGTASSVRALPTGARVGNRRPTSAAPAQTWAPAPDRATTPAQRKKGPGTGQGPAGAEERGRQVRGRGCRPAVRTVDRHPHGRRRDPDDHQPPDARQHQTDRASHLHQPKPNRPTPITGTAPPYPRR